MSELLLWSVRVGRWSGTSIRLHVSLLAYVAARLLGAALDRSGSGPAVVETACWLALLLVVLLAHELAEMAVSGAFGLRPMPVVLWPLGNLVGPWRGPSPGEAGRALAVAAGPAANLAMTMITAAALAPMGVRIQANPFGVVPGGGDPIRLGGGPVASLSAAWWLGWFGYLNWVVFLANLIPALPFDAGRVLRGRLGDLHPERDRTLSPYLARTCAVVLLLGGIFRASTGRPGGLALMGLAVLTEWLVREEARMLEERGDFAAGEGAFGYDFSQGAGDEADAEPGAPAPRPAGALERWRRVRSEQRRLRRARQAAAESARLDEILDRLHRQGRGALSREEQAFLVRVSRRLRGRRSPDA